MLKYAFAFAVGATIGVAIWAFVPVRPKRKAERRVRKLYRDAWQDITAADTPRIVVQQNHAGDNV